MRKLNNDVAIKDPEFNILKVEKYTFRLHLVSQILNGLAIGIALLQEIILKKSLFASDLEVTILVFLVSSSNLFSIYGAEIINRAHNQKRAIILTGIISKSFYFIIPLFQSSSWFILCIAAMSYTDALLRPFWNVVMKHNYTEQKRNIYYSYTATSSTIALLIVSIGVGYLLDIDFRIYKILFPIAGLFDIISFINLGKLIETGKDAHGGFNEKFSGTFSIKLLKDILILPIRSTLKIFKENPSFFRFEKYFFLYGMAFMIVLPAVPIYFVEILKLDYVPISFAKGLIFHGALILFTPVMGRMFGTGNPTKFTGYVFMILALYPLSLFLIEVTGIKSYFPIEWLVYGAFFIYGLSMSGVGISWALSSIYYSPPSQVSNYQAVHITLTGVRGVFSPFLGYAIMKIISINSLFVTSTLLFIIASTLMIREWKLSKRIN
jgi:hypothetical protein